MSGGRGETVAPRSALVAAVVLLGALAAPASALALPPEVGTEAVRATSATTATVLGFVTPSSLTTKYEIVYDLSTSEWCESSAAFGTPSKETTAQILGYVDEEFHEVAVHLAGLTGGTGYCAALRAKNASGAETGFPLAFIAGEPVASTGEARPTGSTTATVSGSVDPAGQATTYKILYDLASSEWCLSGATAGSPANSTSGQQLGYTDANFHDVAVHLTGLTAGSSYCAALQVTNESETATGITTQFSVGTPQAHDSILRSTGANTATLEGGVNPSGESTAYKVLFDLATSEWCTTSGAKGSPANSTPPQALGFTDVSSHSVDVHLTGLAAGQRYCAALQASSEAGTTTATQLTLIAGAPLVGAASSTPTGATTASVSASVNPSGQSTQYKVLYDLATSEWCTSSGAKGAPSKATSEQTLPFTDAGRHQVLVQIGSLTIGTAYCAEVQAMNTSANAASFQVRFTAGSVFASNASVQATGATSASVSAFIGPGGQTTTYKVLYDLASSEWCATAGLKGSPANSTAPQTLGFTDFSGHQVVVHLSGLTSDQRYCEAPQASNGSGSSTGSVISFVSGAPTARTVFVNVTGSTSATVIGSVDPAGQPTKYHVVYDLATSEWCSTFGEKGSPSKSTAETALASADTSEHKVDIGLTGLTAGKSYCAAVSASNASATVTGNPSTFDLIASPPIAETYEAFSTGATTASLLGTVDASGQSTTYKVSYDLATSEWCESEGQTGKPAGQTTAASLGFTDSEEHVVVVNLTGLLAGHQYCAMLQATNASGTALSFPVPFTAGAPSAQAFEVRTTSASTATALGSVAPSGQTTTYKVLYDLASSEWCESGGSSSTPAHSTSAQTLGFTDSHEHLVAVDLTGLTAGAGYCVALQATNGSGTASGFTISFRLGEPVAHTGSAQSTSATSATLSGQIGPAGQTTTYKVVYDLASSEWCESFGATGTPGHATTDQTLGFTDESLHGVSPGIVGLTAGARYCAAIQATNGTATATGSPTTFTAGEPRVSTREGRPTAAGAATIVGFVNPSGQTTTYRVLYDLASSEWCESAGVSGTAADASTPVELGFTDTTSHEVAVGLTGLVSGRQYCAAIQATSGAVTVTSPGYARFTVGEPAASTTGVAATSATAVTVSGLVNASGQTTTYKVVYDLATSEWCESGGSSSAPASATSAGALASEDTDFHEVAVSVSGLTAGTRYCFALQASNSTATATGNLLVSTVGAPSVAATTALPTGSTRAAIEGEVNPSGQATTYKVVYDLSTSEWCESEGMSGAVTNSTSSVALGSTDTSFHKVKVELSGLVAGQEYCAALQASNASSASELVQVRFTVGQPAAATVEGLPTGATTASIVGSVNPAGQSTTYRALYGPAGSEWCESEGESGTPAVSTTAVPLGSTGISEVPVAVAISGLTAGAHYCAVIQASNATATVSGLPPASFTAGAPSATTGEVFATGTTTAKVTGLVNPAGQTTQYKVLYDLASSEWCESGGSSSTPAHSTSAQTLGFTDATGHEVSVGLSGLTTGDTYCAALEAASGPLNSTGFPVTFLASAPLAPEVITHVAVSVTRTGATLEASVNPNGSEVIACKFEYGVTTSYGSSVPCASLPGLGSSPVEVKAALAGLSPGTTYHFRISATNAGGTSEGSDEGFKTTAPIAPEVATGAASNATQTTATLTAKVNPNGSEVIACTFEYGTTSGYGSSVPCGSLPGSGSSPVEVTAAVTGLSSSTSYHFRISATNAGGTSTGADNQVTTQAQASGGGGGSEGGGSGGSGSGGSGSSGSGLGGSGSGGSGSGGSGGGSAPSPAEIAAQLVPSGKGAKLATLLKHAGVALVFEMAEPGTIVIEWFVTPKPAHGKKAKPVLIATGHATASGIQSVTVTMHLTAAGKRLLKGAKQIKVTADATFTPTSGAPVKAARTFQLRR